MDPIALSLIIGGAQAGIGALQRRSASKRRERALANMKYDIPSAVTEQVANARNRASQNGLPGEDITRARVDSNIAQTTAMGESVSQSSGDILGLYSKLFGQKTDFDMQLSEKGAQYKAANEAELNRTLGVMAEAENQQFYYNRFVPFMSEMQYASEEAQGGGANISSGLQTAYTGWMNKWMANEAGGQGTNNPVGNNDPLDFQTKMAKKNIERNSRQWTNDVSSPQDLSVPLGAYSPWVEPDRSMGDFVPSDGNSVKLVNGKWVWE